MKKKILFTLSALISGTSLYGVNVADFDFIDDFIKNGSNYTGPGTYDILDASTGAIGSDGVIDITISITTSGMGPDGNGITWAASDDTTNTGLRSTINPSGSVQANNSGHKACQTIDLIFGPGLIIEAQDITDFGWSSGNTDGTGWETSSLEYEVNGGGFSITVADHGTYANPAATGYTGNGFIASDTGTVTGIGSNQTSNGPNGSSDSLSSTPAGAGIAATDIITGLRFIHCLEDVRGTNNGDTIFTNTLNDLQIPKLRFRAGAFCKHLDFAEHALFIAQEALERRSLFLSYSASGRFTPCMSLEHPFLNQDFPARWTTLKPAHIEADTLKAIENGRVNLEKIKAVTPENATYKNTFAALELATDDLNRCWGRVNHLDSVNNSDEIREALNKMLPQVTEFNSSIPLDGDLWKVLSAFAKSENVSSLDSIKQRFIEETCADFREAGADLSSDDQKKIAKLNSRLAEVTQKFSENVLDSTNAWELYIDDESRLKGIPENALAGAAEDAKAKGKEGQWRFTQQAPSYMPVMQYAEDDTLRKEIWIGSGTIGRAGEYDNSALVWEILKLRHEKAQLLGFSHFPDLVLNRRMAKTGENALKFTTDLHAKVQAQFQEEVTILQDYKAEKTNSSSSLLEPWEWTYWSEKRRQEIYQFDEEALRPYFSIDNVMEGLFKLSSQIFGITIKEADAEAWHPEVKFYELYDSESEDHLGSFYADWHPRESKRGGAWMNYLETGLPAEGNKERTPHLGLICGNMTKPTDDQPALLTHREVETVFHEFGHLLHHLLSDVPLKSLSGVNVPWDFVELPSQIMENFCWNRESLDFFAKHYETDEPIPDDLFQQMTAARNALSASITMRQLAFGKLDLELHLFAEKLAGRDLDEVDAEILADYKTPLATPSPTIIPRFSHLFSSPVGYGSGYYSYKWAEILDADAFTRFEKEGPLNEETGQSFREEILSKGDSRPVDESFRAFLGRDPDAQATASSLWIGEVVDLAFAAGSHGHKKSSRFGELFLKLRIGG